MALDEKQEAAYRQVKWHGAEPVLVVHRLCIAPDQQRKGIAGMFMDFAEDFALQNGYAGIRLDAYSGNPAAVRLYESRGYQKVGQVNFPRRDLPFYCYEKTFSSPQA
jgi:ribosomal protein S18 acetylase RimI-like enzyme